MEIESGGTGMNPGASAWFSRTALRRSGWVIALLTSLAAVWFHSYFVIHAGGLWRDEANTVNVASRHSLEEMANDSFPILMSLMVRGWMALGWGGSDQSLRWLGALVGLGLLSAIWATAWTARRSPPALSLALFGLNSTVIVFGDSLRPFGAGSLSVVLLIAAMCAFLRKSSWGRTGLLAATAVLAVQALFQNAIFVASVCIGLWVVCWRRRAWPGVAKIILVALIAGASLLPYWSRVLPLAKSAPTSGIATLRTEFRPGLAFSSLNSAAGFHMASYAWVWGLLALAVVAHAVVAWRTGVSASDRSPRDVGARDLPVVAAATLLTGLGGFACFLWWAALRPQPWYFLPPMALTAACLELGLPTLRREVYAVFLAFVTMTVLVALPVAWRAVHWRFTNVDLLARRLTAEAAPGDFVLVAPWTRGISFGRYFQSKTPWETVPPLDDHSTHRYDLLQRQTQTHGVMRPVFERIAITLQAGHRVWVVGEMDIPAIRAPVPTDLEPPPRKHTGWSAGPYVRRWTSQTAQFIRNHSRQFVEVPLESTQATTTNEALGLSLAEGWETSQADSPAAP